VTREEHTIHVWEEENEEKVQLEMTLVMRLKP
jgi:hypothetical protein